MKTAWWFTFAGDVPLGKVATLYGFTVPQEEMETSLADFVCARLQEKPKLGDYVSFADKMLVVQEIDGERVTKVGFEL